MKNKKCPLDQFNTHSIGVIEQMKARLNGNVKYKIMYRDYQGRTYSAWTTWMRDDGHNVGDSIPVKNVTIPSFGLLNIPLSIDNNPQRYVEPYVAAMVVAGIGALIAGYHIGKNSKNESTK